MTTSARPGEEGGSGSFVGLPQATKAVGILLVLSSVVLFPGLLLGPHQDAGIFAAVGEQFARGHLPYRDAWDHKPPGVYVIAAVASILPGPTWPAFWATAVAWLASSGMVLRRIVGLPIAAVAVICMGLYPAAVGGGETEAFAALPAAIAFLLAFRCRWLAAGIAAGAAIAFSVQSVPLLVALVVLAGRRPRAIGLGVLGAVLFMAVVIGLLAASGILAEAVDAVVTYNRVYLNSDRTDDLPLVFHMAVVLLPLGVSLPFLSPREFDRADAAAAMWLIVTIVFLATQGRLLAHYVILLGIPLAVLARVPMTRRPAVLAVSFATIAMMTASAFVAAGEAPVHRGRIATEVGEWVKTHTSPGDTILVWGVDAGVYVASERAPAGRYPYDLPLVTPGYTTREMIAEWIASLKAAPPLLIIDGEAANSYWGDAIDFLRPPPPGAAGGRDLDLLGPLRSWAAAEYSFATEIDGRKVYARNVL